MQNLNFLETEFLDIIFQGRNKNYGAYTLRKNYPQRLRNALMITSCFLFAFFAFQYLCNNTPPVTTLPTSEDIDEQVVKIKNLVFPPKTPAAKAGALPAALPKPTITNNIPTEIVRDVPITLPTRQTTSVTPPVINLGQLGTGNSNQQLGNGGADPAGSMLSANTASPNTAATAFEPSIVDVAEFMPVFPGGEDAMMQFLETNLRYPKMAESTGVGGIVYVQFVVNTTGKISNIKILNGVGAGCDEEAIRVIKSMPLWNPGKQNGKKVNVSFMLPVSFVN